MLTRSGDYNENYNGTSNYVWGYVPDSATYGSSSDFDGLMLQNVGVPEPTSILNSYLAFATNGEGSPNRCEPQVNFVGTIINSEASGVLSYAFQLTKEQTVTVTSRYIPF